MYHVTFLTKCHSRWQFWHPNVIKKSQMIYFWLTIVTQNIGIFHQCHPRMNSHEMAFPILNNTSTDNYTTKPRYLASKVCRIHGSSSKRLTSMNLFTYLLRTTSLNLSNYKFNTETSYWMLHVQPIFFKTTSVASQIDAKCSFLKYNPA